LLVLKDWKDEVMDNPKAVLISADALNMLLATSAAFFSMALNSYRRGVPEAPSKDELQAAQNAIAQAVSILGQEASPTLQKILHEVI